jgi:hypothetical protein
VSSDPSASPGLARSRDSAQLHHMDWWDLLKAMDAHEGQAAWAQGFFSVLAILAAIAIDQRALHTQRREAREAALASDRARAEVALAIWMQSSQIYSHSDTVWRKLAQEKASVAAERTYVRWVDEVSEQMELFKILLERASDPILLLHAAHFIRAARPKSSLEAAQAPGSYGGAIQSCTAIMRAASLNLANKSADMARKSGLDPGSYLTPQSA